MKYILPICRKLVLMKNVVQYFFLSIYNSNGYFNDHMKTPVFYHLSF